MAKALLSAAVLALTAPLASSESFLRQKTQGELEEAARASIQTALVSELSVDSVRLREFEDELRPLFMTLPKSEHGGLESPAVRYALHRYFVHTHGWYVTGLEPLGQAWNSTSPAGVVKGRVPAYIQSLFDQRLQGKGLGLHELAAFAATMLDFVHNEVLADVMDLYSALSLPASGSITKAQADQVVKGYVLQILDGITTAQNDSHINAMEENMGQWFPAYADFQMWVQDVRHTISGNRRSRSLAPSDLTLDSVISDVQELNDRLFAFQDIECRHLKSGLMHMQHGASGRVFLSDYYAAGLRGDFLFVEHIDFLKKLGAIDDTDPNHPSVIIANFLTSKANCLTESSLFSVCCLDECQSLYSNLERSIAAPMATPARIAELVSTMPSDTVDAPRNLSTTMFSRLREIADLHDGQVPLHGRLFKQWMHHAYPLECAYPHVADTTRPLTQDEWMDETGADDVTASQEDRVRFSNMHKPAVRSDAELPWMQLEELVAHHKAAHRIIAGAGTFRKFAAFAAVLALGSAVAKFSSRVLVPMEPSKVEKFMV